MTALTLDWADQDIDAFLDFCIACEITDVTVPLSVWANESDNRATAHNPNGDASGIFQLMPRTADGLGYNIGADPHLDEFRKLTIADQLVWATKYYEPLHGHISTIGQFYTATFLPAETIMAADIMHVLCGLSGPYEWAYRSNKGFDKTGKGYVTVLDLVRAAQAAVGPRTKELIARVKAGAITQPDVVPKV